MEKKYKWYIKVVYTNGNVEKGVIMSEFDSSSDDSSGKRDPSRSIFGEGFKPFTISTKHGRAVGVINTAKVASVYLYNNKYYIG